MLRAAHKHVCDGMVMVVVVVTLAALVTAGSSERSDGGLSQGVGRRPGLSPCLEDPHRCDGSGLAHFPLGETWRYSLGGWWDLRLDSGSLKPTTSSRRATLEGLAAITRESPCRLRVALRETFFSDWQRDGAEMVETWVVVDGGSIRAVCGGQEAGQYPGAQRTAHIHSLARSIVSAALSMDPKLHDQRFTLTESDQFGECETEYDTGGVWPGGYEVVRTRDLARCRPTSGPANKGLSSLTTEAVWECRQQFVTQGSDEPVLEKVTCSQSLTLPDAATLASSLTLTFLDARPRHHHAHSHPARMQEVDLEREVAPGPSTTDLTAQVRTHLTHLCTWLARRVTTQAATTYPHLVTHLKHLPTETIVQLYTEVNTGRICPHHPRVRSVYSAALRDASSANAAAAMCHLMTSAAAVFTPSWTASLANVQHPTSEALHTCADLLDGDHWESSVLGVTAMAGNGARTASQGRIGLHCSPRDSRCIEEEERAMREALDAITRRLVLRLRTHHAASDTHQMLLTIHGLGNVGGYGSEAQEELRELGAGESLHTAAVRLAAVTALGKGPCSTQIRNWLKWEILNETVDAELRVAAFQSLHSCSPGEAQQVASLIINKESSTQVKSYVSGFVSEEESGGDSRQLSRHLVANLTALLGLPHTILETDIVFQNSFLPRSIAFNLTSALLKHFGGSAQLGGRLENLEELIQSLFGHKGQVGGSLQEWVLTLLQKAQELFTRASEEFVNAHQRHKRSYSLSDVPELLRKVKQEVVTELRGWVLAGLGGTTRFFSTFALDPLALQWHQLLTSWLDHLLLTSYSSLLQSDVEVTSGWAEVDESVWSWSVVGTPLRLSQHQGGLVSLAAASRLDLLRLLTNPSASTLYMALKPSLGVYSLRRLAVASLTGDVTASSSMLASGAVDVSATLVVQGGDNMELKLDIPRESFHGYSAQITHSLQSAADESADDTDTVSADDDSSAEGDVQCSDEDDVTLGLVEGVGEEQLEAGAPRSSRRSVCNSALEAMLGIKYQADTEWTRSKHVAVIRTRSFLRKSERDITGYKMGFSWKNPGVNSMFLDVHVEVEGSSVEKKAGLIFGLTYSPHFTFKLQLLSQKFSAFAETSVVNDPNLKRIEGHIGLGSMVYGVKAELLMVTDGGHVSVKPRLVVAYPGQQEDALLEGYVARYFSDKVTSVTLDLFSEGTLKEYLDVALKGTAEVRHPPHMDTVVTLKNVHLSSPFFSLGLEAACSLKDDALEGKIQVTWDGQVVMVDVGVMSQRSGDDDQHFTVNFEMLLPDHPHLDTRLLSFTHIHTSEVNNNLTLTIGPEDSRRVFQLSHSTEWKLRRAAEGSTHHRPPFTALAASLLNSLNIKCSDGSLDWTIEHQLQLSDRSLDNCVRAKIGEESHTFTAKFYDQSQHLFKYHIELEISLPAWHFSYVDMLEQRAGGEMVGHSTTVMPSGRVHTSSSRYFKSNVNNTFIFEFSYDILVRDGLRTWKILMEESFEWSGRHISLEASVREGEEAVTGLEVSLKGLNSPQVDFYFKHFVRDLYKCQASLKSEGHETDLGVTLLIIPFNREITSKVVLDHDQCTGGSVDGEVKWDARGDASRTLALSSLLNLPRDGQPLEIRGQFSLLGWQWETVLKVALGRQVGDTHWVTYLLIFPDTSRFNFGSQLGFVVAENNLNITTRFEIHLPSGETHNMSLAADGQLRGSDLEDATLTFSVESPVTEHIELYLHIVNQISKSRSNVGMTVKAFSAASYWEPVNVKTVGAWDGTTINVEVVGSLGTTSLNFEGTGSYMLVDEEHHVSGFVELRIPSLKSWKQLRSSMEGTFSVAHSPGRLKMTHVIIIEKDKKEVFNSDGEVMVHVPEVEGRLRLTRSGASESNHVYTLQGTFIGKELKLEVRGEIDEVPLVITFHYVDGRQVTVYATYREDGYFTLSITTELKNISIGIRKGNGTSYSLTTEGLVELRGQRTRMHHQLAITPETASSVLTLSPFLGQAFMLTSNRTKMSLNHWSTDVSLNWGERTFTYRDEVSFPSLTNWFVKIEIDAPALNMQEVRFEVETSGEGGGEQAVQVVFQEENVTLHKARLVFFKYDSVEEMAWRAGAKDLVLASKVYRDLLISHTISLPHGGLEIVSNMTVGETPVIGVGVKVTPHTRALILSVCTTGDECVRLHAHAHAQATPSTRTYSLAAHALNSLFWRSPEDPLVQNSVTFMAEETAEKVVVSCGVRRVECEQVSCDTTSTLRLLHATIHITPNTLDFLVDTTNRTVELRTVVRGSPGDQATVATLPGGRLVEASTLDTRLWMDRTGDPEGVINWNCSVVHYASARAKEWVIHSSLHHRSFNKVVRVNGTIVAAPTSKSAALFLDLFTRNEDSLRIDLKLLQEHGIYIIVANLSKPMVANPEILKVVAWLLPSPDSGEVRVEVTVPRTPPGHTRALAPPQVLQYTHFTLACSLDATHTYTSLACKLTTPSVHESVLVRYEVCGERWCQGVSQPGCQGVSASVGVLNHTYYTKQMICQRPFSLQSSLSMRTQGSAKEELALKFGLVDVRTAEVDLLDNVHIKLQLHTPFLLQAQAASGGSWWSRWRAIMEEARREVKTLTTLARTVVRGVASDVTSTTDLSQVWRSTPTSSLAQHLHAHAHALLLELREDELLMDILDGARACYDVTSVMIEGGVAYLSHNYGRSISEARVGAGVWVEAALVHTAAWLTHLGQRAANTLISTLTFIADLPEALWNYGLTVPVVGQASQWLLTQVRQVGKSPTFTYARTSLMSAGHLLHKVLSLWYGEGDEGLHRQNTPAEVWNLWVPLPRCSHSLFDVWRHSSGASGGARHQVSLSSVVVRWWHLLTHPARLALHYTPPFTAQGAVIGNTNFVSLDGRSFSLSSPCAHVLVTDARDGLFTLISGWDDAQQGRDYLLLLGNMTVKVTPDLQVSVNGTVVRLPYIRRTVSVKRDLHHLVVRARDLTERDVVTLTCWSPHHACVVSVSGWLHAHTRGLLGNLNLDPSDDFMRPSGKVAAGVEVFGESWQVGPGCQAEAAKVTTPPTTLPSHPCSTLLLHYDAPLFPCHESVDITPFHESCERLLASSRPTDGNITQGEVDVATGGGGAFVDQSVVRNTPAQREASHAQAWLHVTDSNITASADPNTTHIKLNGQSIQSSAVHNQVVNIDGTMHQADNAGATVEEVTTVCDVMAAYVTVCGEHDVTLSLPPLCDIKSGRLVREPVWPTQRLDLLLLVNEAKCDTFMYQHLIRPLPPVLERIARQKNLSDIDIGVVGYGTRGGEVIYHTSGASFLAPVSQFRATQPRNRHHALGTLQQGLRAVTTFPFRSGSVRVAFVVSCDDQDLPKFPESLPQELVRRRLTLFTLTPDRLLLNPSRPTAVRNTIGVDRWRVYNLRLDHPESPDTWGVNTPSSNIAQVALKSGGGVFSVTALREDDKAPYYMKLFRKVLSKAIVKVASNTYKRHLTPTPLN
nr:uncharacterized protein LOC123766095 [Procambarus clarkii]